jgi:hypothetical protein
LYFRLSDFSLTKDKRKKQIKGESAKLSIIALREVKITNNIIRGIQYFFFPFSILIINIIGDENIIFTITPPLITTNGYPGLLFAPNIANSAKPKKLKSIAAMIPIIYMNIEEDKIVLSIVKKLSKSILKHNNP